MTAIAFFGCALTAFGPPLALFVFTVANDPVRVIILILSAFFWLLSLLLSSLLWFAVVPLREQLAFSLVFSVLFQEGFRLLIYLLLKKADSYLKKLTESEHTLIFANRHILSYVVGLGFGLMSGAFSLVNVLADSAGPGTVGFNGEKQAFFMVSAYFCLCMILLNTAWSVITFSAMDQRNWLLVVMVVISHLGVSCLTLANSVTYVGTTIPIGIVTLLTTSYGFKVAGGKFWRFLTCCRRRTAP